MEYTVFKTKWGVFGFVAHGRRLIATFLPQGEASLRRAIARRYPDAVEVKELLPRLRRQVIDYFAGKPTKFAVDADLSAVTPFQQRVLERCRRIPYGKTATYADLARAAGRPGAARAVGGVMASNPLPLVIPCHRVLRSDGSLGGFSSPQGTRGKKRLLAMEGTAV
jgi:methylated-DNA-[protein]-cysteine S-methyltransferase